MSYKILVVDDEVDNLQLFKRTFRRKYDVLSANSGFEALELLEKEKVDLVISDHKMPGMGGVELLKQVLERSPETMRILVTAYTDVSTVMEAINEGKIFRYVRKPWEPGELINIVDSALEIYQLNIDKQKIIFDLKELFSGTINAITEALDAKDPYTSGRSKRVTYYSLETGKALGLSDADLSELELSGLLHDIGMIGIPETILNKPENLSQEEFDLVKKHVTLGVKILEEIKQLGPVIRIVELHHERFDGKGYPYGLKADEIPICARIIAVTDAYDGMVSDRPYRKGLPHEVAIQEIQKSAGTQFDPRVVDAFVSIISFAKSSIESFELSVKELENNQ